MANSLKRSGGRKQLWRRLGKWERQVRSPRYWMQQVGSATCRAILQGLTNCPMKVIKLFLELGNQGGAASSGIISGIAKVTLGEDLETGLELISGSLELFRVLGDDYGAVVALIAFGEGARSEGDEKTAEKYYQEALSLLEGLGDTYWPGHLLQNLAHFRLHQGDWKEAARLARDALAISEKYDYPVVVNLATAAVSGVFLAKGAAKEAAWIIGAIQARLTRFGAQFEPTDNADFQKIISLTRETLGEEQFASCVSKGSSASWEDVLALARSCS